MRGRPIDPAKQAELEKLQAALGANESEKPDLYNKLLELEEEFCIE